jgi:hypothetical protein
MSLPQDLNPVDLFPSSGDSAAAPNELGLTDSCWQLLDKQNQCLSRSDNRQWTKSRDPGMLIQIWLSYWEFWNECDSRCRDWLWAGRSGDRIQVGARFFTYVKTSPGAHPASCTMDTGSLRGVKWPGRGADHPPPSSAEFENEYTYTSTPPLRPWWPI